jgi:hypothetical protein
MGGLSSRNRKAGERFSSTDNASERWIVEKVRLNEAVEGINVEINSISNAYLQVKLFNHERALLMKKSIKLNQVVNTDGFQGLSFLLPGKYLVVVSGEDKTVEKWINKE